MKFKKLLLMLIILSFLLLTGCWSSREINTLAITICVGIDKTENGFLITEQVLNPKAIATENVINESPIILYTEEGKDVFEILRRMTRQSPRKIYNSHLRMVIFGEDIAQEGIQHLLDFFSRDHEYRTDFYFVIAKGTTANEILSILTPLQSVPGISMYNSLEINEKAWASVKPVKIIELVNTIISKGINPVLSGVMITDNEITTNSVDDLKQSDVKNKLKFTDLGAFKNDKLIGWLNEEESKGYNYIVNNIKSTVGYSKFDNQGKITFETIQSKSKIKAYMLNGKPAINVEISAQVNIGGIVGDFDILNVDNIERLNDMSTKMIESLCNSALKKAKSDLNTDIFGFGEVIHRTYPKLWNEIKDDWNDVFIYLPVNIHVDAKINKIGQITTSFFLEEKE